MNKKQQQVTVLPEQILYNTWDATLASGHETYWEDIGDIAELIGVVLEGQSAGGFKSNSIKVLQTKEKFGRIRCSVELASAELVILEFNKLYTTTTKDLPLSYSDFELKSLKRDVQYYRRTYLMFKRLFPHYWTAISSDADFREYLFETEEEYQKDIERNKDWWKNRTPGEIEFIREISGFSKQDNDNNSQTR